ncbi:MAG: HEAT repeat domain-containing protein [Sandaracinaceae bacterium]|nr:HEAT repeat domain-containing protein [Sandaracinaceae bacterium]
MERLLALCERDTHEGERALARIVDGASFEGVALVRPWIAPRLIAWLTAPRWARPVPSAESVARALALVPARRRNLLLRRLLESERPHERRRALLAIEQLGARARGFLPLVIHLARHDRQSSVRAPAVRALAAIGASDARAARAITGALRDSHPRVRRRAVRALAPTRA